MKTKTKYDLPVGFFNFHPKLVYNYQFNRWHSLGFARFEDMKEAGRRIKQFSNWKKVLIDLAEQAQSENRIKNAAIYYRGAEFYINDKDPDKMICYETFLELFSEMVKHDGVESFKIPYNDSYLHGIKVSASTDQRKGTILMHGGFDSFVEEFYFMMRLFSDQGYEVIAYEGPGQGGTRRKYGLAWDEHWEKPTKTVLDYFNCEDVSIYGISMGGHLCFRAAAFEPRIKRIISSGGAIDYWKITNIIAQWMLKFFMRFENLSLKAIEKKMEKNEREKWFAENAMYITKINNPFNASMKMMDMNMENAQPERINQDVLLLSSAKDHFIPLKMHHITLKSLNNARSRKGIIYDEQTHAHNHCQIGNIPLVCSDVLTWLDEIN